MIFLKFIDVYQGEQVESIMALLILAVQQLVMAPVDATARSAIGTAVRIF